MYIVKLDLFVRILTYILVKLDIFVRILIYINYHAFFPKNLIISPPFLNIKEAIAPTILGNISAIFLSIVFFPLPRPFPKVLSPPFKPDTITH